MWTILDFSDLLKKLANFLKTKSRKPCHRLKWSKFYIEVICFHTEMSLVIVEKMPILKKRSRNIVTANQRRPHRADVWNSNLIHCRRQTPKKLEFRSSRVFVENNLEFHSLLKCGISIVRERVRNFVCGRKGIRLYNKIGICEQNSSAKYIQANRIYQVGELISSILYSNLCQIYLVIAVIVVAWNCNKK